MICQDMPKVYSAWGGAPIIRAYCRRWMGRRRHFRGRGYRSGPICLRIEDDRRILEAIHPDLLRIESVDIERRSVLSIRVRIVNSPRKSQQSQLCYHDRRRQLYPGWQTQHQQDQLVVDLVVEVVVATEEAEAVVEVVVDQEKMRKKNGFQSQNSVDSYELAKSSQWRYRVGPIFSRM